MATITIGWTDATGAATLSNLKTDPGNRLSNWTPAHKPIGPVAHALGTGLRYMFEFRNDETVSFELRSIPNTELAKMLRLQMHLLRGGSVTLATDNVLFADFVTCTLAPDTAPDISFSDTTFLEYTFGVTLLAGATGVGSLGSGGSGSLGGTTFSPLSIADLWIWLKADALTPLGYVNNDVVTTWVDSSGGGNHAPGVTHAPLTPNSPVYKSNVLNGLPVVHFPVTGVSMQGAQCESPTLPIASGRTIVFVARRIGSAVPNGSFCSLSTSDTRFHERDFSATEEWTYSSPDTNLGGVTSAWGMLSIVANAGVAQCYRNGVAVGSTFNPNDNIVASFKFIVGGAYTTGGTNANCQFAEALVFQRELDLSEIVDLHGYLNTKWALGF